MKGNLIIDARNITKVYGKKKVLDEVSIKVEKGEIYGLVGNNGAGKSTLFKILTGIIEDYKGDFMLLGASDKNSYYGVRKHIGALIEHPGLFHELSVRDNLEYYRIQRGIPNKDRVKEIIELMGLKEDEKKKAGKLSLGKKQRLGIGLALISNPNLLILDEPINGLDPEAIGEFRNMILKLNREKQVTVIISSHILAELESIATKYGFLKNGKLLEEISKEELKDKCRKYVRIKVSDNEIYTANLEETYGCRDYKVMPDGALHIYEDLDNARKYNELANKLGVDLKEFVIKEGNLEEYYMNIIKEEV